MTLLERPQPTHVPICRLESLIPGRGITALVDQRAIAIFMLGPDRVFAIDNVDPCSGASVLSRGLVGQTIEDGAEVTYVASPIRKERFELATGRCLDRDATVATWAVRVIDGTIEVAVEASSASNGPETMP